MSLGRLVPLFTMSKADGGPDRSVTA